MPDRPIYPATIFFTYAANVAIAAALGYAALAILGRAGGGGQHVGLRVAPALLLPAVSPFCTLSLSSSSPVLAPTILSCLACRTIRL